jgi:hypothetical protein
MLDQSRMVVNRPLKILGMLQLLSLGLLKQFVGLNITF